MMAIVSLPCKRKKSKILSETISELKTMTSIVVAWLGHLAGSMQTGL